jgi:hypothetical protein
MDMASLVEELVKAYVDGMPLDTIKDKIKDIVTTYYKDNVFTISIYLIDYSRICIHINLSNLPTFNIHSNYIGRAIDEIVNYFKLLGFKEI